MFCSLVEKLISSNHLQPLDISLTVLRSVTSLTVPLAPCSKWWSRFTLQLEKELGKTGRGNLSFSHLYTFLADCSVRAVQSQGCHGPGSMAGICVT